jgi:hypothetical protein
MVDIKMIHYCFWIFYVGHPLLTIIDACFFGIIKHTHTHKHVEPQHTQYSHTHVEPQHTQYTHNIIHTLGGQV